MPERFAHMDWAKLQEGAPAGFCDKCYATLNAFRTSGFTEGRELALEALRWVPWDMATAGIDQLPSPDELERLWALPYSEDAKLELPAELSSELIATIAYARCLNGWYNYKQAVAIAMAAAPSWRWKALEMERERPGSHPRVRIAASGWGSWSTSEAGGELPDPSEAARTVPTDLTDRLRGLTPDARFVLWMLGGITRRHYVCSADVFRRLKMPAPVLHEAFQSLEDAGLGSRDLSVNERLMLCTGDQLKVMARRAGASVSGRKAVIADRLASTMAEADIDECLATWGLNLDAPVAIGPLEAKSPKPLRAVADLWASLVCQEVWSEDTSLEAWLASEAGLGLDSGDEPSSDTSGPALVGPKPDWLRWRSVLRPHALVRADDESVYAIGDNTTPLARLADETGAVVWESGEAISGSVVPVGEFVFTCAWKASAVQCRSAFDGRLLWSRSVDDLWNGYAWTGSLLVVRGSRGLTAFDQDGNVAWTYARTQLRAPVTDGTVVVVEAAGRCFYVIDAATGSQLNRIPIDPSLTPGRGQLALIHGRLWTTGSSVSGLCTTAFDYLSGHISYTHATGSVDTPVQAAGDYLVLPTFGSPGLTLVDARTCVLRHQLSHPGLGSDLLYPCNSLEIVTHDATSIVVTATIDGWDNLVFYHPDDPEPFDAVPLPAGASEFDLPIPVCLKSATQTLRGILALVDGTPALLDTDSLRSRVPAQSTRSDRIALLDSVTRIATDQFDLEVTDGPPTASDQAPLEHLWYLVVTTFIPAGGGSYTVTTDVKDHQDEWDSGWIGEDPDELIHDLEDGDRAFLAPGDPYPDWWQPTGSDSAIPASAWRAVSRSQGAGRETVFECWGAIEYEDLTVLATWARANPERASLYPGLNRLAAQS